MRKALAYSTVSLLLSIFGVFFVGPLGVLVSHIEWGSVGEIWESYSFFRVLGITFITGVIGAAWSVFWGILFAWIFSQYDWKGKRVERLALVIPYLVPNFILASAYVVAWNPGTGLANGLLPFPGGLYGAVGLSIVFGVAHMPVAFLVLEEKFRRLDFSLVEAARISGLGPARAFLTIQVPCLKGPILSAFNLAFVLNVSAFAIPAWIGNPGRTYTLTYKIYQELQLGGETGIPRAAAYSLVLFLMVVPMILIGAWGSREKRATVTGKAARKQSQPMQRWAWWGFQSFYFFSQGVFWVLPLICLMLTTVVTPGCLQQEGLSCLSSPTFQNYSYVLFGLDEARVALYGSIVYGSLSAFMILLLCAPVLVLTYGEKLRRQAFQWVFSVPYALPGAVLALAMIVSFSGRFEINFYNTAWILMIAYIAKHLLMAFQTLATSLDTISPSLLEASRVSGAGVLTTWKRILTPLLRADVLSAFLLVLIPILGELTMSVFLQSPRVKTIGTVLFDLQDYANQGAAGALSVLLVILILSMNETARWLSRGKLGY